MRRFAVVVTCILASRSFAFGWSRESHAAIGLIAAQQLHGSSTESRIGKLLGGLTLADIATCPDEVRNFEQHQTPMTANCAKLFPKPPTATAPWHFINIPVKSAGTEPSEAEIDAACAGQCVTVQIQKFTSVLAKAKPKDKGKKKLAQQQALSFVVHFVGDVHQPLHAADRDGDHGGNDEHVSFFGEDATLHHIWDYNIVARINPDPNSLTNDLASEIAQASGQPQGTPNDWAVASYDYARDVAYSGIPPANSTADVADLGQPYQDAAAPVVRIQIARAGVRLAAVLKTALP